MSDVPTVRSFCTGYGGLDAAVLRMFGGRLVSWWDGPARAETQHAEPEQRGDALAYANGPRLEKRNGRDGGELPAIERNGHAVSDALGVGWEERRPEPARQLWRPDAAECGVPDPGRWGAYAEAVARWESIRQLSAPDATEIGRRGGRVLSPRFVEWMMGLDPGHVTDTPGLSRPAQVAALGNGVVPQQAEAALRHLVGVLARYSTLMYSGEHQPARPGSHDEPDHREVE